MGADVICNIVAKSIRLLRVHWSEQPVKIGRTLRCPKTFNNVSIAQLDRAFAS